MFLIVGGALLGYLSIWKPYNEALTGSQTIQLNRTGIALAILFPLMGVILAIGGEAASNHIKAQTTGKKTKLGWVYIAIIAAIALGVHWVVETRFESLGYTV
ncbi:MAG: hypothetical protein H7099_01270 [Gemmatimonadaceae bacterium]|nr:hypothetical protein [Gemmatimonadaceae bacterium]